MGRSSEISQGLSFPIKLPSWGGTGTFHFVRNQKAITPLSMNEDSPPCKLTPSWSVARPPHQLAMEPPCLHLPRLKAETQIYWVRVRVNVYAFILD